MSLGYTLQKPIINHQLVIAASHQVLGEDIVEQGQKEMWKRVFVTGFIASIVVGAVMGGLYA